MANPQNRVQLKGSNRAALPGRQDAGPADLKEQIEIGSPRLAAKKIH